MSIHACLDAISCLVDRDLDFLAHFILRISTPLTSGQTCDAFESGGTASVVFLKNNFFDVLQTSIFPSGNCKNLLLQIVVIRRVQTFRSFQSLGCILAYSTELALFDLCCVQS